MADGYLEQHQREYEQRRDAYRRRQRHLSPLKPSLLRPDDEAL